MHAARRDSDLNLGASSGAVLAVHYGYQRPVLTVDIEIKHRLVAQMFDYADGGINKPVTRPIDAQMLRPNAH